MSKGCKESPEKCCNRSITEESPSNKKQVTLENMKCVVVMSEIMQHKTILENPRSTTKQIISSLFKLGKKIPPKHVLHETKLDKLVKRMTKSVDDDISKAARSVYNKWKSYHKQFEQVEKIDVLCDSTTEKLRSQNRQCLAKALKLKDTDDLAYQIEKETFLHCGRLVTQHYKTCICNMVSVLTEDRCTRYKMKLGQLHVKDFVKQYIEV